MSAGGLKISLRPTRGKRKRRKIRSILPVGTRLPCLFLDGKKKAMCEIISTRRDGKNKNQHIYYVHYINYDKRLDRWVTEKDLDLKQIGVQKTEEELNNPSKPSIVFTEKNGRKRVKFILRSDGNKKQVSQRKVTRSLKRKLDEAHHSYEEERIHDPELLQLEKEHAEMTKVKNIEKIQMGSWAIDTWYFSPYPQNIIGSSKELFICEFCLKYFRVKKALKKHKQELCDWKHPPGDEIYRDGKFSFWEIDGCKQKLYCQNLCLLAKLFLDHKTLYYDVEPFLFYIFTHYDERGAHMIGYFSKEKNSDAGYNLACILTLPSYQRKGYGKYLIHFSYHISMLERSVGSPEIPLSDLGRVAYYSYWKTAILAVLKKRPNSQINDIMFLTSIRREDVVFTLQSLKLLKYWKGENVVAASVKTVDELFEKRKQIKKIDLTKLYYVPWKEREGVPSKSKTKTEKKTKP